MTRFLLFLLPSLILLFGCQSDEPEKEPPPAEEPVDKEEQKNQALEQARLLNEKYALQKELEKILAEADLDPDARLQEITDSIQAAREEFSELRKNHPQLQKLNKEISLWQQKLLSATSSGNEGALNRARAKLQSLRGEISQLSKGLPELATLEEAIMRSQKEANEIRRDLAGQSPEGQELLDRLRDLEEKIEALADPANDER